MKCIEICCGAGGLAIGEEIAGFEHLLLLDFDKHCIETLRQNRPDWNSICQDITTFDIQSFMKTINLKPGELELLSAGIPCQPFSFAGLRNGLNDKRTDTFSALLNFIEYLQPKIILIENVKGLKFHKDFDNIINSIKNYNIYHKVLDANDFDTAQKRERIFIVGVNVNFSSDKFVFPEKKQKKLVLRDVLDIDETDDYQKILYEYNNDFKLLMNKIPPGGCWRNLNPEEQRTLLKNSYTSSGGKTGIAKRLSMDKPSPTLTTSPIQKQTCRCHPIHTRPLTVREYARIQGFPDDWKFSGSRSKMYHQIGNAVPVGLAVAISKQIKNFLDINTSYINWIDNNILDELIKNMLNEYKQPVDNIFIDVFKKSFDCKFYNIENEDYMQIEYKRILDKKINNAIGYFHENVLKNCYGWKQYNKYSMDICDENETIFIQLKNKFNTLNSSGNNFLKLQMKKILQDKPETKFVVLGLINDKELVGRNVEYIRNIDKTRKITSSKLYEFITGSKTAYNDLLNYINNYKD